MKTLRILLALLLLTALLPAANAFAQGRMAEIDDAKRLLEDNPTFNNRLRMGTLQYLEGSDQLKAGNLAGAIDMMQAGVWTLEDGAGLIPETHPVFEEARYGLSFALLENNNPYEGLLVLEQLVAASPNYGKARYLLGVTLMSIPGEKSLQRGVDVMRQLAQDGAPPYKEMAARAATRFAYDLSTLAHAQGDPGKANATLNQVTGELGSDMGASGKENNMVKFAKGLYLRDMGDEFGALDAFEALFASEPNYQLSNGVALRGILSNTYYGAGLKQLGLGGTGAANVAVDLFSKSLEVGDPEAVDAHHGKAVAYLMLEDEASAVEEIKMIIKKDVSYYNKIKK
jgi:tetratricopeptide (TPR) repeat protein